VPSDGVIAAAMETDPGLLEHAFSKDVVIASPATLMALLRTVAHTWRTDALNRDARTVLETGRELHHRLGAMTGHLAKVGRSLDSSVAAFNQAVGSLQSRVMVTARRFEDLDLTATALEDVEQLTRRSRTLEDTQIADLAGGAQHPSAAHPEGRAGRAQRRAATGRHRAGRFRTPRSRPPRWASCGCRRRRGSSSPGAARAAGRT